MPCCSESRPDGAVEAKILGGESYSCSGLPVAGGGTVNAATYTYTNTTTGTTTQWAAGTNWDVVPVSASDTALVFGAGAGLVNTNVLTANNDVADPFVLNSLTMSYAGTGTGTNFAKVTISGGTLNFVSNGGIGPTLALNATGSTGAGLNTIPQISIDANVSLSDALTVTGNSSAIINGIVSGSVGITKNAGSSGILALAGANTYTGVTTISNGSISVRHNQGLGTTDGATVVTAGGALLMSGGVTVTGESLAIDGDGAATAGACAMNPATTPGQATLRWGAPPPRGSSPLQER
ncbi:hypothetical protein [Verrucomicrobium spinosum]|uniref:hypothetical protein n=1 Tax=Verrucomicrobium spinosum TaxID=2736 RepID=UPI000B239594|nr:hypothetical protein [Verrucomicrobium spinosum]